MGLTINLFWRLTLSRLENTDLGGVLSPLWGKRFSAAKSERCCRKHILPPAETFMFFAGKSVRCRTDYLNGRHKYKRRV
ncbi:MAG: hypothetical protein LBU84_03950 [Prevotella sp.]|nr:hypothetical protein [Prevotella sp.]